MSTAEPNASSVVERPSLILALLTADGCLACASLDPQRLVSSLSAADNSHFASVVELRFSSRSAETILSSRCLRTGARMDAPNAAAFQPYALAFPMWIIIPESEWLRARNQGPGFSYPGSATITAHVPKWKLVTADSECGTKTHSLVPAEDSDHRLPPSMSDCIEMVRSGRAISGAATSQAVPSEGTVRYVSSQVRQRELGGAFRPGRAQISGGP